jgi:hypothetical protein
MSLTSEYAINRISQHRLCKTHGWDPLIILGFAKSLAIMQEETTMSGKKVLKINGKNICSGAQEPRGKYKPRQGK